MEGQTGRIRKRKRQVIGDRVVINPRTRLFHLRDTGGNVIDTVRLSMEVCGCGYSYARPGVGYAGPHGWYCKRCGQLHTVDKAKARGAGKDLPHLKPDPALAREFDQRDAGLRRLVNPRGSRRRSISERKEIGTAWTNQGHRNGTRDLARSG